MLLRSISLLFYLLIIVVNYSVPAVALNLIKDNNKYDFEPLTRNIEINEDSQYSIYFNEINKNQTQIDFCYYQSDTGISGSYFINTTSTTRRVAATVVVASDAANNIETFSFQCGITLSKTVAGYGPRSWTIIAHDKYNDQNYTETVTVNTYYNIPLFLNPVNVLVKSSFYQLVQPPSNVTIKSCIVNYETTQITLDPNSTNAIFFNNTNDDRAIQSRLTGLARGKCGFLLANVRLDDPKEWTFMVTANNKTYRAISQVQVFSPDSDLINRTLSVHLGDSATVICAKENAFGEEVQYYCDLHNPKGVLVSKQKACSYAIELVTIDDIGVWRCSIGFRFTIDTLEYTTQLIKSEPESVTTWSEDQDPYHHTIGCALRNHEKSSILYCRLTRPDGQTLKVHMGAATARYTTLSTDLSAGICSLEIVKPLNNEERGTWKCELNGILDSTKTGAYIRVEQDSNIPYEKQIKKMVHSSRPFTIECVVPYSSTYCHITAPNQTRYPPDNIYTTGLGECSLTVDHATATDQGKWFCTFAKKDSPDEVITVDVSIAEITVLYTNVEVTKGDAAELVCNTGGIPVKYCQFKSPSGTTYYLNKVDLNSSKYRYIGRGLEYGDCGIKITKTDSNDGGQWVCYVSIGQGNYQTDAAELSRTPMLKLYTTSGYRIAQSVGISVGIIAVVVITGILAWFRWRRSVNSENVAMSVQFAPRTSNNSSDSGSINDEQTRISQFNSTSSYTNNS